MTTQRLKVQPQSSYRTKLSILFKTEAISIPIGRLVVGFDPPMALSSSSSSSPRCFSPSSPYPRPSAAHFISNKLTSKPKLFRPTPLPSLRISSPPLADWAKSRTGAPPQRRSGPSGTWACSQGAADGSSLFSKRFSEFKDYFWRFLRPHTIRGTALGSTALVTKALIENLNLINWWLTIKALYGLIALICGNGYIVGINQIYDIGIDKVNKPYLPIAAGDLSVQSAWILVLSFAAAGLLIVALNFGPFITSLYCLGLFLGTIYSVPPFRLKKYPVAAFLIIAAVRGFLLNFGVYYATRAALGLNFKWSSPVAFITAFVTLFAMVIAITKDLSDVEGDRKFQISTLATKLGVRNIALLGSGLLLANYLSAILVAIYVPQAFRRSIMIPSHTLLALGLIFQTWVLEQAKYTKEAISEFYRFIWNLFYAEYIIFPLI